MKRALPRVAPFAIAAFALLGAAAACNSIAELDVTYTPDPLATPDGGTLPDGAPADAGARKVRDSSFEAEPFPTIEFDAAPLGSCEGGLASEALCDPSAGVGCCVRSDPAQSECLNQLDFKLHCLGSGKPSALFVACVQSIDDNECCWRKENGHPYAVYVKSCADVGGTKACTDSEQCPTGLTCNLSTCHPEIKIGECGQPGAAGPVCP